MPPVEVSCRKHRLTQKFAQQFSEMITIPHDRDLKEQRVDYLREQVASGEFYTPDWATCFCKETGETYRINGKHSSTMIAEDGVPSTVKEVVVHHFEAETLQDVATLYTRFDPPESVKTPADNLKAITAFDDLINSLNVKFKNDVAKAIEIGNNPEFKHKKTNIRDRGLGMMTPEAKKFIVWLKENLYEGFSGRGHVWRSPIMAAMYLTYQQSQKDTLEFWSRVRDESGEAPDMPCRRLAKWLDANTLKNSAAIQREFFVRSLYAWNAYRQGTMSFTSTYSKTWNLPKVL